ncbi:ABC transporter permease [Paraburkholderia caribensis]|uniref:ABC transporter permease n=1 Tax=Paraburkholderia caribensis TaxID=75105 RepID=UPI001CAF087C|nr:ABC transporter permease subunit [Paraburkholderia caribensis]CAG9269661.1 Transporter [Paraburkholderia caribensis]
MTSQLAVAMRSPVGFSQKSTLRIAAATILLLAVTYLVVMPLVRLQMLAFDGGFSQGYGQSDVMHIIVTTVALGLGSLAIGLGLGTLLAWASTRLSHKSRILPILPILPIVIPSVAAVSGWVFLLAPTPGYLNAAFRMLPWWSDLTDGPVNIYSMQWIIILTGFTLTAFVYLFIREGFANIGADYLEAAAVCGSSSLRVFFTITLPLLRPAMIYGGGVALLLGLGQFTAPLLLGRNEGIVPITTNIFNLMTDTPARYEAASAMGTPLLIFGILVVAAQKLGLGDQRRFVTHGGKGFRATERSSKLAAAVIIIYTLVSIVLPLIGLVILALSKFWSANVIPSKWSLDNFAVIFSDPRITSAITNSIVYSLVAVAILLPTGFAAASIILRTKRYPVIGKLLDFVIALPLGVPSVLFGVAFLLVYSRGPLPLYGTPWAMIIVYITLMLPFATRMQMTTMLALGESYQEASRMSGAGPWRTLAKIMLPLMRSSIGGAAALIFVLLTHEFTASVLVRSIDTNVMGTILFDFWSNGDYPAVAAIALVMSCVTAVGVAAAMVVGGSESLRRL